MTGAAGAAAGDDAPPSSQSATTTTTGSRLFGADVNMSGHISGGVTTSARPGDAPLPAPPPDGLAAATRGMGALADLSSGRTAAAAVGGTVVAVSSPKSDGDTPNLMNADWNWDEDALDAQLFSFLLDA